MPAIFRMNTDTAPADFPLPGFGRAVCGMDLAISEIDRRSMPSPALPTYHR